MLRGDYKYGKYFYRIVGFAAILVIIFMLRANDFPKQMGKVAGEFKPADNLVGYLDSLYQLTDENPEELCPHAELMVQDLWRKPTTAKEKEAYANLILNFGYHFLQQGQIVRSSSWYEKGLAYTDAEVPGYNTIEFILKPLGNNYVREGNYDHALALQQRAISEAKQQQLTSLLPSLYSNAAITFYWLHDFNNSLQYADSGLALTGNEVIVKGMLYNVKAEAALGLHDNKKASVYNKKSLTVLQNETEDQPAIWRVSALQMSAKLLSASGKNRNAIEPLQIAENILTDHFSGSRNREIAKIKIDLGNLYLLLKEPEKAKQYFQDALALFSVAQENLFPENTVTTAYEGLGKSWEAQNRDSAIAYYILAVSNDNYTAQLIPATYNSINKNFTDGDLAEKTITLLHKKYLETSDAKWLQKQLWITEMSKARKLIDANNEVKREAGDSIQKMNFAILRNEYQLLAVAVTDSSKKIISARIRELESSTGNSKRSYEQLVLPSKFDEFIKKVNASSAKNSLVSFYVAKDSLFTIVVHQNKFTEITKSVAGLQPEIEKFTEAYFTNSSTAYNNDPDKYFIRAKNIYANLLPFANDKTSLIISAHSWLNKLPFEALVAQVGQHFIGEDISFSYLQSLMQLKETTGKKIAVNAVGMISFTKAWQEFEAIPATLQEEKNIKKFVQVENTPAANTDEKVFLSMLEKYPVLQIASHAVANDSSAPYVVLQQKFYLSQMQYLFTNTSLVVLSSCESGAGKLQGNEGLMSLSRGFLSKGVTGVVSSRWNVEDAMVPDYMESFYGALSQGEDPGSALLKARKTYLAKSTSLAEKNPLLWAGFFYNGTEQAFTFHKQSFLYGYLAAGFVFLVIVFVIIRKKIKS